MNGTEILTALAKLLAAQENVKIDFKITKGERNEKN